MSTDDSGFLSRWSQRKHAAAQHESEKSVERTGDAVVLPSDVHLETASENDADLSSLPKLEDIVADTDLSGFLKKGVPESLRNAALRKSWALDPAIRSYVNPALDYAYDWNTPGGVPGSSELGAGVDVARIVSTILGSGNSEDAKSDLAKSELASGQSIGEVKLSQPTGAAASETENAIPPLPAGGDNFSAATEQLDQTLGNFDIAEGSERASATAVDAAAQQVVRRHGSAKPKD